MLIGNGANGKSVMLFVIEALIGSTNVAAVQPSNFKEKHQRAHLHGKLANLITEIAEGEIIADAQLKAIVSGEMTTAEHKFNPPFDFHPYATCWFATNHMPHTRDFSEALFRRAIILEFNNRFDGEQCDPNLINKLTLELPGIFNMALGAIGGVLYRDRFSTCDSSEEIKLKWRHEADQVAQFVEEMCIQVAHEKTNTTILYTAYEFWARDSGIRNKLTKKNFGIRLEKLGYPPSRTNKHRLHIGLLLKTGFHIPPWHNHISG